MLSVQVSDCLLTVDKKRVKISDLSNSLDCAYNIPTVEKNILFFFFKKHFSNVKNLLSFEKSGKVKAAAKYWLRVHKWMDWVSGGWIIIGYWCFCCCCFRKGKSVILSLLQTDTRSAKQKQGKLSFFEAATREYRVLLLLHLFQLHKSQTTHLYFMQHYNTDPLSFSILRWHESWWWCGEQKNTNYVLSFDNVDGDDNGLFTVPLVFMFNRSSSSSFILAISLPLSLTLLLRHHIWWYDDHDHHQIIFF